MLNKLADLDLPRGAQVVQKWLDSHEYELQVFELPDSTRTAAEAARAIGCEVGQIVKSLVFQTKSSNRPILILASGRNQVNNKVVSKFLGEEIQKADANYVRKVTGFSIGGVPPIGHSTNLHPLIDTDLLGYDEIWAAAGTPFSVFRLTPDQLMAMTKGVILAID